MMIKNILVYIYIQTQLKSVLTHTPSRCIYAYNRIGIFVDLSENMLPQNPVVNHHFAYSNGPFRSFWWYTPSLDTEWIP